MDYEKEIMELKESLAKRGIKIRELELDFIQQEKKILDLESELNNHKNNQNAHQL